MTNNKRKGSGTGQVKRKPAPKRKTTTRTKKKCTAKATRRPVKAKRKTKAPTKTKPKRTAKLAAAIEHTISLSQSAKRAKAIELLAAGSSAREAAAALKVSRETIANWKQEDAFARDVQSRVDEFTEEIRGKFFALQDSAVDCLKIQMEKGGAAGVRAAIAVLQVSGVMSTPRIPPRLLDLFKGKVLDLRFVDPADLADAACGSVLGAASATRNA